VSPCLRKLLRRRFPPDVRQQRGLGCVVLEHDRVLALVVDTCLAGSGTAKTVTAMSTTPMKAPCGANFGIATSSKVSAIAGVSYTEIVIRLSTDVTPGADHEARSAS